MAISMSILIFLFTVTLQGLEASPVLSEKLTLQRQLELLNKPAVKSFTTEYGEILDCVEIHKQLAFDHPSLKNHTIQMQPSFGVSKTAKSKDSSFNEASSAIVLPKNIQCPRGTVIVKRIKEDDLILNNMISSSLGIVYRSNNNSSVSGPNDAGPQPAGQQTGLMKTFLKTKGVGGKVNVWNLPATESQSILASIFVTSADGPTYNHIQAGAAVIPGVTKVNNSILYGYWTKDDGRTTGCLNNLCPGFVQTSAKFPIGLVFSRFSTYKGRQFFADVKIKQDDTTKNWMFTLKEEVVGYWPKELFTTLTSGATEAGWGGGILSPNPEPAPGMGSGHFPEEGFGKACFVGGLQLYGLDAFPTHDYLFYALSKPDCYRAKYFTNKYGSLGRMVYFGGPPNCQF